MSYAHAPKVQQRSCRLFFSDLLISGGQGPLALERKKMEKKKGYKKKRSVPRHLGDGRYCGAKSSPHVTVGEGGVGNTASFNSLPLEIIYIYYIYKFEGQ